MNKIRTFFYVLVKTFSSPSYYLDILKAPFSFSLKFFYFYFLLYVVAATIIAIPQLLLPFTNTLATLPAKIEQLYPAELEIKIINGEASTNVPEPYYFSLKKPEAKVLKEQTPNVENVVLVENLLVIDTKGNVENFNAYKTYALLTKKNLVVLDENGTLRVTSLSEVKNTTINRQFVRNIISQFSPFLKFVLPILIVGLFVVLLIFLPISEMFYLLFFSLITLLIAKILSFRISYEKSYQLGLHLIVIPATFFGVLQALKVSLPIPFLRTIIMIILAVVVLNRLKQIEENTPKAEIKPV